MVARRSMALYSLTLVGAITLLWRRTAWAAAAVVLIGAPGLAAFCVGNERRSKRSIGNALETLDSLFEAAISGWQEHANLEEDQLRNLVDLTLDLLDRKQRHKLNSIARSAQLQPPLSDVSDLAVGGRSGSALWHTLRRLRESLQREAGSEDTRRCLLLVASEVAEELEHLRAQAALAPCAPDRASRANRRRTFALVSLLATATALSVLWFQGRIKLPGTA